MSNDKFAATFWNPRNELTICADEWRDQACPFSAGQIVHICVRPPEHDGRHECSCGSVVID